MSQSNCNCNCDCPTESITVPVAGLGLTLTMDKCCSAGGTPGGSGVGLLNYSYDEQFTGRYWVDGKKIYQKTVHFGRLPVGDSSGVSKKVPHGIANIDYMVTFEASAKGLAQDYFITLPQVNPVVRPNNLNSSIFCAVQKADIHIITRDPAFGDYDGYVTIFYTCTDR